MKSVIMKQKPLKKNQTVILELRDTMTKLKKIQERPNHAEKKNQ